LRAGFVLRYVFVFSRAQCLPGGVLIIVFISFIYWSVERRAEQRLFERVETRDPGAALALDPLWKLAKNSKCRERQKDF